MGWWQRLQALDDTVLAGGPLGERHARFTETLLLRAQVCGAVAGLFLVVDLAVARQPAASLLLLGVGTGIGAAVGKVAAAGAADDVEELPRVATAAATVSPVPPRVAVVFSALLLAGLLLAVGVAGAVNPVSAIFASIAMQALLQRAAVAAVESEQDLEVLCRPSGGKPVVRAAAAA